VTLALLLSQFAMAQTPQLDPTDSDYVAQVVAANASKTNAELLAFHVKSIREATSADRPESEASAPVFNRMFIDTIIAGTSGNKRYEFITKDSRSGKLKVGESYPVVLGMAMLDMKRHKVNVKDKNSAVFLIPQSGKEPIQFRAVIKEVEEQ